MSENNKTMIPKVIHYCWFGGNKLPHYAKRNIVSWKKFFPEYEIKEWNETNFDINICAYVREAYSAKKWAFVSDYARFWILYTCGGIYFDTDVEAIKNFDDIIAKGPFMGLQSEIEVAPGLGLAANPGLGLFKDILDYYEKQHFIMNEVSAKQITVVEHVTAILKENGLKDIQGIQEVRGVYIYPKDYFNPMDHETGELLITQNTHSIHHYAASWCNDGSRLRGKVYRFLTRYFGSRFSKTVKDIWQHYKRKTRND